MEKGVVPTADKHNTMLPVMTVTQYEQLQQQLRDLTVQVGRVSDVLGNTREQLIRIETSVDAHINWSSVLAERIKKLEESDLSQQLTSSETRLRLDWMGAVLGGAGVVLGAVGKEVWTWLHGK